jgi:hypothetical protein
LLPYDTQEMLQSLRTKNIPTRILIHDTIWQGGFGDSDGVQRQPFWVRLDRNTPKPQYKWTVSLYHHKFRSCMTDCTGHPKRIPYVVRHPRRRGCHFTSPLAMQQMPNQETSQPHHAGHTFPRPRLLSFINSPWPVDFYFFSPEFAV